VRVRSSPEPPLPDEPLHLLPEPALDDGGELQHGGAAGRYMQKRSCSRSHPQKPSKKRKSRTPTTPRLASSAAHQLAPAASAQQTSGAAPSGQAPKAQAVERAGEAASGRVGSVERAGEAASGRLGSVDSWSERPTRRGGERPSGERESMTPSCACRVGPLGALGLGGCKHKE
jgi:hypothetical protein